MELLLFWLVAGLVLLALISLIGSCVFLMKEWPADISKVVVSSPFNQIPGPTKTSLNATNRQLTLCLEKNVPMTDNPTFKDLIFENEYGDNLPTNRPAKINKLDDGYPVDFIGEG